MKTIKPFFKAFLESLNPNAYAHLSTRSPAKAFHYFVSVVMLAFLVLVLAGLPGFAKVPQALESNLEKFSQLEISIKAEMTEPIILKSASGDNIITIDTTGAVQNRTTETLLITKEKMYYAPSVPLAKSREYNMTDLKDLVKNREKAVFLLWMLILLIMPGILMISFIAYLIKYLFFVLLATGLALVITKLMKTRVRAKHVLNIAFYAATPMIILDAVGTQFTRMYGIPYLAFLFYFIVGIALNADSGPAFQEKSLKKTKE
ncbi:DUF1189 domain-containing protein [Candidatus Woesearchaeota archaeon]|nr:MAG: DUF1189 domain-containing protein [Candidatus Woesearchaeota archaeon]